MWLELRLRPVTAVEWCERRADSLIRYLTSPIGAAGLICAVLWAFLGDTVAADPDLFARVAMGRLVERDGLVPMTDPFAFTPKHSLWIDHEWLAGVAFWQIAQAGGDWLLFWSKILFAFATAYLLLQTQRLVLGRDLHSIWLAAGLAGSAVVWASTIRAQVFTYIFLALLLYLLALRSRRYSLKPLALAPPLFAVWANCHGGFIVGLGFLGLHLLGVCFSDRERIVPALIILCGSIVATLVNPYGTAYWEFLGVAWSMSRPGITEWAAISLMSTKAVVPLTFAAVLALGIWRDRSAVRFDVVLMLGVAFVFGLRHERLMPVFYFVAVTLGSPLVQSMHRLGAPILQRWFTMGRRVVAVGALGLLIWSGAHLGMKLARGEPGTLDYRFYPVRATEWLRSSGLTGNILVNFNWGSFVLWRLFPAFQISVDGRYEEVYPQSTVDRVANALNPGSTSRREALAILSPDFILLPCADTACESQLPDATTWHVLFQDGEHAILARREIAPGSDKAPSPFRTWSPAF